MAIAGVTARALLGKPGEGSSTLYQQLAKMLYVPGRSGTLAKAEQILLGVKLALSYPKAEILQMYSSVAYFGHGYYGLQAASCGYFAVAPAALTWSQAACSRAWCRHRLRTTRSRTSPSPRARRHMC